MTDATELCIEVLAKALPGLEVSSEPTLGVEGDIPGRPFVTVSQTGGESTQWLSRPVMAVLAWAPSDAVANALAIDCLSALRDASFVHPKLSAVEQMSLARDTWLEGGRGRYRLVVRLTINE